MSAPTEAQRAIWRASANRYYANHFPAINLWKNIQQQAKKRGIILPVLGQEELTKHTPMDLIQLYRLPADLMTDRARENYQKNLAKQAQMKSNSTTCTCDKSQYLCTCKGKDGHG